jgi:hypothetical protein
MLLIFNLVTRSKSFGALECAAIIDGRLLPLGHLFLLPGVIVGRLQTPDNLHRLLISNLAEDNVTAIQPASDNRGDEELGTVGVRAGVGHGEQAGAGVLQLEVLIGELLAVDGLATGAVAAGEITALDHKVLDNAVEAGALVPETLLPSAQRSEVLRSLRDNIVVKSQVDTARLPLNSFSGLVVRIENGSIPGDLEKDFGLGHVGGRYGEGSGRDPNAGLKRWRDGSELTGWKIAKEGGRSEGRAMAG